MAHFLYANIGFALHNVRVMTDEAETPWDLPNKENILRRPCGISLLPLDFVQLERRGH